MAAGAGSLSFPERLLPVSCKRREKVADDSARAGLDLDRHRHAGAELDELVLHLHVRAVERDVRRIFQLLAFWLAAALCRARRTVVRSNLPVARDGVGRDAEHVPMQEPVAREFERILLQRPPTALTVRLTPKRDNVR